MTAESHRAFAARASAAIWGLGLAFSIARHLQHRAPANALPSAMTAAGLDASSPIRQILVIIALPMLCAFAADLVWRASEARGPRPEAWVINTAAIALATAPLSLVAGGRTKHVVMHALVAMAVIACRRLRPRFSRSDVILIPVVLIAYFALLDLSPHGKPVTLWIAAAVLTLALRLSIGMLSNAPRPAYAFALAPLAIAGPWPVVNIVWLVVTPLLLARQDWRPLPKLIATIVYPVFVIGYPLALLGVTTPPHLDFFEDGHELLPASEMLRGERPYADIVPVHALLSDGGLDYLVMKSGHSSVGDLLKVRRVISSVNLAAVYCIAFAATASAEAGLLAALLAVALFPAATVWVRTLAALFALAASVAALRTQRPRWLAIAGALLVVAFLFGIEFAVYSALVSLIAAIRMRDRRRSLLALAGGVAAAAVPLFIVLAVLGFAGSFLRVTFTELLPAGGLYVPAPLQVPEFLRSFRGLVAAAGNPHSLLVLLWFVAVVSSAAMLARRRSRADATWIIGVWIAIAAVSFAQRHHQYYAFAVAPFVIASLMYVRRRDRRAFVTLAIVTGVLAMPLAHVFDLATPLRTGAADRASADIPVSAVSRGEGAVAPPEISRAIGAADGFVKSRLKPGDTWFDFANAGALYYFLDRDAPIRHHQTVFYEQPAAQREVIATLERNRNIRAALVSFPGPGNAIDGISNRDRAPLVARYLDEHFRPAFDQNGVVFWIRR